MKNNKTKKTIKKTNNKVEKKELIKEEIMDKKSIDNGKANIEIEKKESVKEENTKKTWQDKMLNIVLTIIIVFLGIVVLINGYTAISKHILKKNYVDIFGYSYMSVESNSMYPYMEKGNTIIIKLNEEFKVGDVVTYTEGNSFVTHRITKIDGIMVTTKGDYNNSEDLPFPSSNIIGVVKFVLN